MGIEKNAGIWQYPNFGNNFINFVDAKDKYFRPIRDSETFINNSCWSLYKTDSVRLSPKELCLWN